MNQFQVRKLKETLLNLQQDIKLRQDQNVIYTFEQQDSSYQEDCNLIYFAAKPQIYNAIRSEPYFLKKKFICYQDMNDDKNLFTIFYNQKNDLKEISDITMAQLYFFQNEQEKQQIIQEYKYIQNIPYHSCLPCLSDSPLIQSYKFIGFEYPNFEGTILEYCKYQKQLKQDQKNEYKYLVNRLINQLLEGIIYMHKFNIIHYDINPFTVYVNEFEEVVFCRFGRAFNKQNSKLQINYQPLKYDGPEIKKQSQLNFRFDYYSVGMLINEILLDAYFDKVQYHIQDYEMLDSSNDYQNNFLYQSPIIQAIQPLLNENPSDRHSFNIVLQKYNQAVLSQQNIFDSQNHLNISSLNMESYLLQFAFQNQRITNEQFDRMIKIVNQLPQVSELILDFRNSTFEQEQMFDFFDSLIKYQPYCLAFRFKVGNINLSSPTFFMITYYIFKNKKLQLLDLDFKHYFFIGKQNEMLKTIFEQHNLCELYLDFSFTDVICPSYFQKKKPNKNMRKVVLNYRKSSRYCDKSKFFLFFIDFSVNAKEFVLDLADSSIDRYDFDKNGVNDKHSSNGKIFKLNINGNFIDDTKLDTLINYIKYFNYLNTLELNFTSCEMTCSELIKVLRDIYDQFNYLVKIKLTFDKIMIMPIVYKELRIPSHLKEYSLSIRKTGLEVDGFQYLLEKTAIVYQSTKIYFDISQNNLKRDTVYQIINNQFNPLPLQSEADSIQLRFQQQRDSMTADDILQDESDGLTVYV
ncbi:protein kinase (macronuclear) [Tetrahymena thermophila SB210]|uniref:Protein kinase n=1 Tax=Tetrahymena thermophila (strain SB210) TaxID=312017 RepID=Q22CU5_TETTS|nr:protein kinase [Tetrahymena thermophila SB210]EAR83093.2 protein kinase [Tetrahymena thermophila SB210]|eukprot:XP_001030756.2 protein kinase [Tetrahymena thermophila SB210]